MDVKIGYRSLPHEGISENLRFSGAFFTVKRRAKGWGEARFPEGFVIMRYEVPTSLIIESIPEDRIFVTSSDAFVRGEVIEEVPKGSYRFSYMED